VVFCIQSPKSYLLNSFNYEIGRKKRNW